jgi:H+-translocating NAD(P) transhydrogenase subunit alpha
MKVGIVKEIRPDEKRVAVAPHTVERLVKDGFEVVIEAGAGTSASFPDRQYEAAGATLAATAKEVWDSADIVAKVRAPGVHPEYGHEVDLIREGCLLISFFFPAQHKELIEQIAARKASVIAIDCIPRISRAQKVDALSSMANIAGYRAVVEAANHFGSFFTGQFTAAGRVPPAKVLVIGAGVAGLAAVAAARGLGAIVRAFDTRAAVKEQVESLGGEFLELDFEESGEGAGGYAKVMSKEFIDAEMALFAEQAREVNIVITTALIPGKKAPTLWTADHVQAMRPGSVVVDLAAEQGGNCELTEPGKVVVEHGVTIIGYADLPSRMANVASDLYGTNLWHLLDEMGGAKNFDIDLDNDIVRGALVLKDGELMWPPPPPVEVEPEVKESHEGLDPDQLDKSGPVIAAAEGREARPAGRGVSAVLLSLLALILAGGWVYLRATMGTESLSPEVWIFLQHLTVFVLACFVGWQVIWNVTPALHTPLMSVTNAISGIIIVGGVLQGHGEMFSAPLMIGAVATLFATINIVGGFYVTQRMLRMFRK